jgi:sugar lactone lactonase YvrE
VNLRIGTMKPAWVSLSLLLASMACGQQYVIDTVAGGVPPPTPTRRLFLASQGTFGIAADPAGNVYVPNSSLHVVFRLDASGAVTRVAGNARVGYAGDGGQAINAQLNTPNGLAVDGAGNLFIADSGNRRIRKVSPDGIITTVAGLDTCCGSGDGGPALNAQMSYPFGLALDGTGNLFVADLYGDRVRKISPDGIITTVAGNGTNGFSGDGGPATAAQLRAPAAVVIDSTGKLHIADYNNARIRGVTPAGIITTEQTVKSLGLALDRDDNLFIADWGGGCVRKVSVSGAMTVVLGNNMYCSDAANPVKPSNVVSVLPYSVAVDGAGNAFIADALGGRIHKIATDGGVTLVAVGDYSCCYSGDGGPATRAQLWNPAGVALDGQGSLYVADAGNSKIRKVSPDGLIATVASGCGWPDDYDAPCAIAADKRGNVYVADSTGVNRIGPDGASIVVWDRPCYSIAVDNTGNLYIANQFVHQIRRLAATGEMTVVAGDGTLGYSGDGGPATSAQLSFPMALAVDPDGNLYFADHQTKPRIRKVSRDGVITTVAGGGSGTLLDGTSAVVGELREVIGLAADAAGNVFFQEFSAFYPTFLEIPRRVRKISSDGIVTTIAGTGDPGYSGDGGPATQARLNPQANERGNNLAIDNAGNVYVADAGNNAVRILRPQ